MGSHTKREEAIAFLKEIVANQVLQFKWVSLVNEESGGYELQIKPEIEDLERLKPILEKHNLGLREANGVLVVNRKHDGSQ